jgi:hypothetical protein
MAKANPLSSNLKHDINKFMDRFKDFSRSEGGEVSIFDFLDTDVSSHTDIKLINFLRALQQDVNKIGIDELDLDLDFRVENVMMWNGNLVMVDW